MDLSALRALIDSVTPDEVFTLVWDLAAEVGMATVESTTELQSRALALVGEDA
jgi:hypothetical protein